jgi:uncharacterized repeat protein (TIGR04052 family)
MRLIFPYLSCLLSVGSLFYILNSHTSQQAIATQTQTVTIRFAGQVGNQPFSCQKSYPLGNPKVTVNPLDFRFYLSDIALINDNGQVVPLTLVQDGKWQYQNVALLDFENKSGTCTNGTKETRNIIIGQVPTGNYKGLKFTLGLPPKLNHEDATLAPSPLNLTSLWWNWRFGYKFARIDFAYQSTATRIKHTKPQTNSEAFNGFAIHLGSTGCQAEASNQKPTTTCSNPNTTTIHFSQFNPISNTVIADIAQLVAETDLSKNQPNTPIGCMSTPDDSDCVGIMQSLGIPFPGKTSEQTFFRVK